MAPGVVSLTRARIEAALDQAIDRAASAPAVWGRDDCALWCADVLRGPLGYDPVAAYRGRYSTPLGYRRVIRREGFTDLLEALGAVAGRCGWEPIEAAAARVGDVGIMRHPSGFTCAIRGSAFWLARREPTGISFRRDYLILKAWSVLP